MNFTGRRDSVVSISPLCVFLLVLMVPTSISKATTNVLLSGESLSQGAVLGYAQSKARLELRYDCNLVLYNAKNVIVWQSKTDRWFLPSCNLYFTKNGQLVLSGNSLTGPISWTTNNVNSKAGNYTAIVLPEGKLSIYGPIIWIVGDAKKRIGNSDSNNDNGMVSSMIELRNTHLVYNALFSGDILYDKGRPYEQGKLTDGEYSFAITKACELELQNTEGRILWNSGTNRDGDNCYATFNNHGELAIKDDTNRQVWINDLPKVEPKGNYLLLLRRDGYVAIYGPEAWSVPNLPSGFIKMHTDNEK